MTFLKVYAMIYKVYTLQNQEEYDIPKGEPIGAWIIELCQDWRVDYVRVNTAKFCPDRGGQI